MHSVHGHTCDTTFPSSMTEAEVAAASTNDFMLVGPHRASEVYRHVKH